jgi:hypothetical protein
MFHDHIGIIIGHEQPIEIERLLNDDVQGIEHFDAQLSVVVGDVGEVQQRQGEIVRLAEIRGREKDVLVAALRPSPMDCPGSCGEIATEGFNHAVDPLVGRRTPRKLPSSISFLFFSHTAASVCISK